MTKIKRIIKNRGLRLNTVATMIGIKPNTVSAACKQGIKTKRIAERYAAVLGCNWQDLMD